MRAEVEAYLDQAARAIEEARYLLGGGYWDAAVTRAYYAMFHAVEALFERRQIDVSSHHAMISLFGREFVRTGELPPECGRRLNIAFERRQSADYNVAARHGRETAAEQIAWAEEFLQAVRDLLK